jgi:hypothetical protein
MTVSKQRFVQDLKSALRAECEKIVAEETGAAVERMRKRARDEAERIAPSPIRSV